MDTSGRTRPEASAAVAQSLVANGLEQVREILVGSHHRELSRRLARTDARIVAEAEELRSDARRRLEALEAHLRRECDALAASIAAQQSTQREALDGVAHASQKAVGTLEQRVERLEELLGRTQRDFQEQLLAQAKSFIDEVQRTRAELTFAIEREGAAADEPAEAEDADQRDPAEHHREAA